MLVAETHGKILPEALNHEDYLTSAVFGDLRLITPKRFWQSFLRRAKSQVDDSPLTEALTCPVDDYSALQTWFWPSHPEHGEPDVVLKFHGDHHAALIVVIEVKLWSGK